MDIKGFLETSFLDWPGKIASVLFLPGCNFRCPFCHNHGLVLNHQAYPSLPWRDVKARLGKFRGWIDGVVVTGGEPTLSPDLPDLLNQIKQAGFQVKLDTNGSRPEVLQSLMNMGLLDHVAMDVKGPLDETSYARAAGRPGFVDAVRQSLDLLEAWDRPYSLRTTVVPQLHSESDVFCLARQLPSAPDWTLQSFNPENALRSEYRAFTPWDADYFENLTARALEMRTCPA